MQNISDKTLHLILLEMRKEDKDSNKMLHFSAINRIIQKFELPISPCLTVMNKKFEDEANPGFTNYEHFVR